MIKKSLLIAAGVLAVGGGVAWAQTPPPPPPGGPGGGFAGGPPRGMEHWHGHHRPDDGAAFFHFRRGDADIAIKCPAMENVQACVSAAGTLMDKVAAMGQTKAQ